MRRSIIVIPAAIVLGLITTVALIAGGTFITPGGMAADRFSLSDRGWFVTVSKVPMQPHLTARIERTDLEVVPDVVSDPRLPWWWPELRRPELAADEAGYHLSVYASGWPYPALRWGLEFFLHADDSNDDVVSIFQIMWSGFFANVTLFSFGWLLLLRAPRAVRYVRRRRRGLCPACAYDQRGAPSATCSECGADQAMLQRRAKRGRCGYAIAALFVAAIVAVPSADIWRHAAAERARFADGGWLDDVIAGRLRQADEAEYERFIRRVRAMPGHEHTIAERITALSPQQRWEVADLVIGLCALEARDSYLPLIDKLVGFLPDEHRLFPLMAYGIYPWSVIGDRLVALREQSEDDGHELTGALVTVVRLSWTHHPEPDSRAEVEAFLRRLLDDENPRTAMRALHALLEWGWMNRDAARERLADYIERDPDLRDDWHFESISAKLGGNE